MRRMVMRLVWVCVVMLMTGLFVVQAQETGYTIPADPDDMDASLVIATIGDTQITLGQYRERVRYERWRLLASLSRVVDEGGQSVLDFQDQSNPFLPALQNIAALLADEDNFGALIYEFMISDAVYRSEAATRGLDLSACELDNEWARVLFLNQSPDCLFSDEFEMLQLAYLADVETFTGASSDAVVGYLSGQAESVLVRDEVAIAVEAPSVTLVQSRHIRTQQAFEAAEALSRINAGEDFTDVMVDLTIDPGVQGNGGNLGFFSAGQMVSPFEQAAFDAEINTFVGPVETQFGFHVIEVLERSPQIRARHILVRTAEDATTALERIEGGEDFADVALEMSIDRDSAGSSGDLGFITSGQFDPALEAVLFSADVGALTGPVETAGGFHVVEVTLRDEENVALNARHILVDTTAQAEDVIARLEDGEDFEELAGEVSIDPTAGGNGGDTLTIVSGGQESGFYERGMLPPDMDEAIFTADVDAVVGPFGTQVGFFIVQITAQETRQPTADEIAEAQNTFADSWQDERLAADDIERSELWRGFVPNDPLPTDISEQLLPFETLLGLFAGQ